MIDGIHDPRDAWSPAQRQARPAGRGDRPRGSTRAASSTTTPSGNLGSMHTSNFYPNFVPIQELSDWFEHWATEGVKPVFTCEYMRARAPGTGRCIAAGTRASGSSAAPPCRGSSASPSGTPSSSATAPTRSASRRRRTSAGRPSSSAAGKLWHRWDYPAPGRLDATSTNATRSSAKYLTDNWRAFRTWGVSANLALGARPLLEAPRRRRQAPQGTRRSTGRTCSGPASAPTTSTSATSAWTWPSSASDWIPTADGQALLPQQPAAAGLHRRQAGRVHQQGPQLLAGRDRREAAHRHQQLARDGDGRLPLVARPAAGRSAAREQVTVATGPAGAHPAALRRCRPTWRRARTS